MATIPSLALIPSGYKASKVYSVLPTDGTGDFTFTRSGNATRVNSEGLIELVSTNVPRLNYPLIDGVVQGCPSLLLEPQRINLVQYSEDFSNAYWSKLNSTIISNQAISPSGNLDADKLVDDTVNTSHRFISTAFSTTSVDYTASIFVKKDEIRYAYLRVNDSGGTYISGTFDLQDGVVTQEENGNLIIENFGNGWYRIVGTATSNANGSSYIELRTSKTPIYSNYVGNESDGLYVWGAQIESGSYPTSYIPNYGTALGVTRSAETCNGVGDVNTFNDSEGVLFAEVSAFNDSSIWRGISISDGTISNKVSYFATGRGNANEARFDIIAAGSFQVINYVVLNDITNSNKVAIKYKANDVGMWVNGFRLALDTNATMPSGLSKIQFANGNTSSPAENYYGNTKQIQYFDSALTDSELETLTSWVSFSDMATSQLYTIE